MSEFKKRIQGVVAKASDPREATNLQAAERARIVEESWKNYPGKNLDGQASFSFNKGDVIIGAMEYVEEPDGTACIHIWTGEKRGRAQYRIINPPILVEDPSGDVEIQIINPKGRTASRRFREDPVRAVAEGIAVSRGSSR